MAHPLFLERKSKGRHGEVGGPTFVKKINNQNNKREIVFDFGTAKEKTQKWLAQGGKQKGLRGKVEDGLDKLNCDWKPKAASREVELKQGKSGGRGREVCK